MSDRSKEATERALSRMDWDVDFDAEARLEEWNARLTGALRNVLDAPTPYRVMKAEVEARVVLAGVSDWMKEREGASS